MQVTGLLTDVSGTEVLSEELFCALSFVDGSAYLTMFCSGLLSFLHRHRFGIFVEVLSAKSFEGMEGVSSQGTCLVVDELINVVVMDIVLRVQVLGEIGHGGGVDVKGGAILQHPAFHDLAGNGFVVVHIVGDGGGEANDFGLGGGSHVDVAETVTAFCGFAAYFRLNSIERAVHELHHADAELLAFVGNELRTSFLGHGGLAFFKKEKCKDFETKCKELKTRESKKFLTLLGCFEVQIAKNEGLSAKCNEFVRFL